MFDLYPTQRECVAAIIAAITQGEDPLCVLPTGSGKTVIFSELARQLLSAGQAKRVWIVAHRLELISQAETKLRRHWPDAPVSVICNGLDRIERNGGVVVASVGTIRGLAYTLQPPDLIIIDEAHRVPDDPTSMYKRLLNAARTNNHALRVVGFTATPYRLNGGHIAGNGKVFSRVCYQADVRAMIEGGYLCRLRSKYTGIMPDLEGVRILTGDYDQGELARRVDADSVVCKAVDAIVQRGMDRKCWLIFCVGVAHAEHVASLLAGKGIETRVVTGTTPKEERRAILADYAEGRIRAVCNVNVLTEGFDEPRIDLIAMLRPTQSAALYVQMAGRGFRRAEGKADCLVLDMGGNVERHGPVDAVSVDPPTGRMRERTGPLVKTCPACEELVAIAMADCPACGHVFFEKQEPPHDDCPSEAPILSDEDIPTLAISDWVMDAGLFYKRDRKAIFAELVQNGDEDFYREVVDRGGDGWCFERDGEFYWSPYALKAIRGFSTESTNLGRGDADLYHYIRHTMRHEARASQHQSARMCLSVQEIAQCLGVRPSAVAKWVSTGELRGKALGKQNAIVLGMDFQAFLATRANTIPYHKHYRDTKDQRAYAGKASLQPI